MGITVSFGALVALSWGVLGVLAAAGAIGVKAAVAVAVGAYLVSVGVLCAVAR